MKKCTFLIFFLLTITSHSSALKINLKQSFLKWTGYEIASSHYGDLKLSEGKIHKKMVNLLADILLPT